jgi:transcriptional regulator with XRE-family HTH domain
MTEYWTYSESLRAARLRMKLTQLEAATRIGVKERAWGSWERGAHAPSLEHLATIVSELGIPPEQVGYEAPQGWELVPSEWLRNAHQQIIDKLDKIYDCQTKAATLLIKTDNTQPPKLKY